MEEKYRSYLALLEAMREGLSRLTELANRKTAVVRQDDLMGLDEVLKKEQAQAMAFRGLEQKREKLHQELNMEGRPLSGVASAFPPDLRLEAKQAVEALQSQYKIYNTSAKVARNTLEVNLHEIDKILSHMGSTPAGGTGYGGGQAEPPSAMKTDFRA